MRRKRPGDRDTLALAARELVGAMVGILGKAHHLEIACHARVALVLAELGKLQQRILDVLRRGKHRQKVKGLEDKADGTGTKIGKLVRGLAGHILALHHHLAAARRVDTPDDVQKRRLATSGRARNGQEYARLDRERDVTDRLDVLLAEAVVLADVFEFYDCHPGLQSQTRC